MKKIYLVTMKQTIEVTAQDEYEAENEAYELFDHANTKFIIEQPQEGKASYADYEEKN